MDLKNKISKAPQELIDYVMAKKTKSVRHAVSFHSDSEPLSDEQLLYCKSALESALEKVQSAQEGTRNHTLNTESFNMGQIIGIGGIEQAETYEKLLDSALKSGLSEHEASKTIHSGLEAGIQQPRQLPKLRIESEQPPIPEPIANENTNKNESWNTPIPLKLNKVEPLLIEILPTTLQGFVNDECYRMQCPPDLLVSACFSVLGSVIGTKVKICPKQKDDWRETPNLWALGIGTPSSMKSPSFKKGINPIKVLDKKAQDKFNAELKAYNKLTDEQKKDALLPLRRRYFISDATPEKLGEILAENPNGVMSYMDELSGLLKSFDKKGYEIARGLYLTAWNANDSYTFDRISRGNIYIEACCVSVCGTIQPDVVKELFLNSNSTNDGLFQRFSLMTYPEAPDDWDEVDEEPNMEAKNTYHNTVKQLDELDTSHLEMLGEDRVIRFSPEAQPYFNEWYKALKKELLQEFENSGFHNHLAKYPKLVPTLALIIELADNPKATSIGVLSIKKALALYQYYRSHAKKIYNMGYIHTAELMLIKLEKSKLEDGFTLNDICSNDWGGLKNRDTVKIALNTLCEYGYLKSRKRNNFGRPTTEYLINPAIKEKK